MLRVRWFKIINDLLGNKIRTILIVLSIAVGLFAVGIIIGSQAILSIEMDRSFETISPSTGTVRTAEYFEEDFVRSVRSMPEVEDVEARRSLQVRVKIGPDEWENLTLYAVEDYENMRVNKIFSDQGTWPPPEREILIERAAIQLLNTEIGDTVTIEMPNDKKRELRVAGTAHDMILIPAWMDGTPYAYVSFETLEWMGEPYGFNELHIIAINRDDAEFTNQVTNDVKDKAEKIGYTIPLSMTAEPGELPLDDVLNAILFLMGTLGVLSLFLSMFLIINTVSALLAQQKRQIGVMKAIGANTMQLMGMYLVMVIFYGLIAIVISVPLSIMGSRTLSLFMAQLFNFNLLSLEVPLQASLVQVAVGIIIPVLASLYPFLANLRITASEAMSSHELTKGKFGRGMIDRLISGTNLWFARNFLRRPYLLSLRNTFRSKGRLALTLITLTTAGAIFISVFSVRSSLFSTVDGMMQQWNFDAYIVFNQNYRNERIIEETNRVPGVESTDVWYSMAGRRVRPDDTESGMIYMFCPNAASDLFKSPAITEGRWLLPEDENAIVVSANTFKDEPDLGLGKEMILKVEGEEVKFQIVGVSVGISVPMAYANYPYIAKVTGNYDQASAALIRTEHQGDTEYVNEMVKVLENHYEDVGLHVSSVHTMTREQEEAEAAFSIVIYLLLVMAVLLALVGGLGLMGTMSINVLERTREIGVLRAIGAPNRGVARVFTREGVTIGLISWLFGSVIAFPLSKLLSDAVGAPLVGMPLTFSYSVEGAILWLVVVIILSAIASAIPARNASRLTVREVLAYE